MEGTTIVSRCLTFTEVIALDLVAVASKPFPVNFIKVVGLHHSTADNADTWCWLEGELDVAEHDVPS